MPTPSESADLCIQELDKRGCDMGLLLYLRHGWDMLASCQHGQRVLHFVEVDMRLTRAEVEVDEFHARVQEIFRSRPIRPIAPRRTVFAYFMDLMWSKEENAQWPQPYFPYVLQMKPGYFILFTTWQDLFLELRHIAVNRRFQNADLKQLYEKQIPGRPSRIILDLEMYEAHLGGRMSARELEECMADVPRWFVTRLTEIGAISPKARVTAVQKVKTRPDAKSRGMKVSSHIIFNIAGLTKGDQMAVLRKIFADPVQELRAEYKKTGSLAHVDLKDGFPKELLGDLSAMHGTCQFATLFAMKPGEGYPRLEHVYRITDGGRTVVREPAPWAGQTHEPTHADALEMLRLACFSHPLEDMVFLKRSFHSSLHQVGAWRAACCEARTHAHPGGGRQKMGWGGRPPGHMRSQARFPQK